MLISPSVHDHHVISAHDLEERMYFTFLATQSVNVNEREKDLSIFYFTFLHNLHVNQGGKLTLQTD